MNKPPRFVTKPTIKHSKEKLTISCEVEGKPRPTLQWFKGSDTVKEGQKMRSFSTARGLMTVAGLEIFNVTQADGGTYTVKAANALGEANANINLNFSTKQDANQSPGTAPTFTSKPTIKQEAGKLLLECNLSAIPEPAITWYKDETELQPSGRFKVLLKQTPNNTYYLALEISNVNAADQAVYKVNAHNSFGESNASIKLNFAQGGGEQNNGKAPTFTSKPTIEQGDNCLKLRCQVDCAPAPKVLWYFGNTLCKTTDRIVINSKRKEGSDIYDLSLDILGPQASDGGTYRCNAKNEFGESNANIALNLQGLKGGPTFLQKPKVTQKDGNVIIEVVCQATKVQLDWFREDKPIISGQKHQIKTVVTGDKHTSTLTIVDFKKGDEGIYKVRAKNEQGEGSATISITLREMISMAKTFRPVLSSKPEVLYDNGCIIIRQYVVCGERPVVTVFLNNRVLPKSAKHSTDISEDGLAHLVTHRIKEPSQVSDSGTYKIVMKTGKGEASQTVPVQVNDLLKKAGPKEKDAAPKKGDPPAFIQTLTSVTVDDGKTASLQAKVKGTPPIQCSWFKQDMEVKGDSKNIFTTFKNNIATLEIKDAMVEDSGLYFLKASNAHGNTQTSANILVKGVARLSKDALPPGYENEGPKRKTKTAEPTSPTEEKQGPHFIKKPQNHTVVEGETVTISFAIEGEYMPEIRFFKGKREIKPGNKTKFNVDAAAKTGTISMIKPKYIDEGKYSVQLLSNSNTVCDDANFNIYVKDPKDSQLDFRDLLKHKDHKKRQSQEDDPDWGQLKHLDREPSLEQTQPGSGRNSGRNSRRGSSVAEIEMPALRKVSTDNTLDPAKLHNQERRASLAEVIPDWPTLQHREKVQQEVPVFIRELEDQNLKEEDGHCVMEAEFSIPNPRKVRWFKNKLEIFHGNNIHLEHLDCIHKLTIKKLSPKDAGKYILLCDDVKTSGWIEVAEKAKRFTFSTPLPKNYKADVGKDAQLECFLNDQSARVVWKLDGKPMTNKGGKCLMSQRGNRHILKLSKITPEMAGRISCETATGDTTACEFEVTEPDYNFVDVLKDVDVLELNTGEMVCLVSHESAPVKWFKGPAEGKLIQLHPTKNRIEFVANKLHRSIVIHKTVEDDEGKYWCQVGNHRCSANYRVTPEVRFIDPLATKHALENRKTVLVTLVENPHNKPVTWYRNGEEIKADERLHPVAEKLDHQSHIDKHLLIIDNAEMTDAAEYTCKVGSQTTSAKLIVDEAMKPPALALNNLPKVLHVKAGQPVSVELPFTGTDPIIKWNKDGNKLDKHQKVRSEKEKLVLAIDKASRADSGTYKVKLSNDAGEVECPIVIKVVDKPGKPEDIEPEEIWADNILIRWKEPKDDGGEPILHYVIESKNITKRGQSWSKSGQTSTKDFRVNKLKQGEEYKFRVSAVNSEGQGPWEEYKTSIEAKDPYDPPGAPTDLLSDKVEASSIELSWKAPATDGGTPIKQYLVEGKTAKDQNWVKMAEVSTLNAKVDDLRENTDYQFRVKAVNKAGESKPAQLTVPVKTKKKLRKPKIDARHWNDLVRKIGQSFELQCTYTGVPEPSIEWIRVDDETLEVTTVEQEFITTKNMTTCVKIKEPKRLHRGCYKVTARNELGEDTASCDVVILGPPGRPEGPLLVKDVTAESALLTWNKPTDTGGDEVLNYIVEKLDTRTGDWEKVKSVPGNTTELKIPKLKEGHDYMFRVKAENIHGQSPALVTEDSIKAKNPFTAPAAPNKPRLADADRNFIDIEWDAPNDGGSPITGYIVERLDKSKPSANWQPVTRSPIKEKHFVDEKVKANMPYEYRVSAVNAGGESSPSPSTGLIKARPLKEAPKFDLSSLFGAKDIRVKAGEPLKITLGCQGSPTPTVSWSNNGQPIVDGPESKLSQDDETISLDIPRCSRANAGKYTIKAKNNLGEESADLNVVVLDAPGAPGGPLDISDVSANQMTLSWKEPADECGAPVSDYVVEMLDPDTGLWVKPNCLVNGTCTTVKGLQEGKKYAFRVKAVNMYGTGEPLQSETVAAKNPFDRPSAPKDLEMVDFDQYSTTLQWKKPESDGGNAIKGYQVEKKEKGKDWQPVSGVIPSTKCTVPCIEGKTYEFRVSAVNDGGAGEPCKATKPHLCRVPINAAGAPSQPKVDAITKNSVSLSWSKPRDDGGALDKYIVEKKTPDGDWVEVAEVPANLTSTTVKSLPEGETCQFRVRGVNAAGLGEPSKPTDKIVVEDQPEKPGINEGNVPNEITVRAGQPLNLAIPYSGGHPPPTAKWTLDDNPVDEKRAIIETNKAEALLTIPKCVRGDTGPYKLVLTNPSGSVETEVKVNVLDVPAAPEGPIDFKDMMGDSMTLTWNAPKDNGGSDITNYVVEKKPVGANKWSKVNSFVPGTHCPVKNLEVGKQYEFRVVAENQFGQSAPLITTEPITAKHPFDVPDKPGKPEALETTPNSITLEWEAPRRNGGNPIVGYMVEKRLKGETKWAKASRELIKDESMTARNLLPNKEYEFRVCAVNEAGPSLWSDNSAAIEARHPTVVPKINRSYLPSDVNAEVGKEFKIAIPYTGGPIKAAKFSVNGSPIPQNDRTNVKITPTEVIFINKCADKDDDGKYTVDLVNEKGQDSCDLKVNVRGKPSKPEGPMEVSEVTAESCKLSWKAPKDSGGAPISHYIVEKMDAADGVWNKVTKFCRGTTYQPTDLINGHSYMFRVSAVNEFGESEPLDTEKSTKAAPHFALPGNPSKMEVLDVDKGEVSLQWARPVDDGGDRIQGYLVEYRPKGGHWTKHNDGVIKELNATVKGLKDCEYEFRVRAKNSAGVSEPSNPISVDVKPKSSAPSKPGQPEVVKTGKHHCDLRWTLPKSDGGTRIKGYNVEVREYPDGTWQKANDYLIVEPHYTVMDLQTQKPYEFRVVALNAVGPSEHSLPSMAATPRDPADELQPEFTKKLSSQTVPVGEVAKFSTEFDGKPKRVQWFFKDAEIFPDAKYQIHTTETSSLLTINGTDANDSGNIRCHISNKNGADESSAKLFAVAKPTLTSQVPAQSAELGDHHKVKFSFSGTGPFSFKVKKDGKEIPANNARVKLNTFDDHANLVFAETMKDDTGDWSVEIANDNGVCQVNFPLTIRATPGFCRAPLKVSDTTFNSANLSWLPPTDDGGSKILHYVVERKEMGKSYWTTVSSQGCRDTNFECQGLTPNAEYHFRVAAANANGVGPFLETAHPIIAKLPYDTPGAPGIPEVEEVGNDFVNLSWEKPADDGGGRITGYIVERREPKAEKWTRVNYTPVMALQYNIANLIEDFTYEFRVLAVNEAGEGKPSAISSRVVVKDPKAASLPVFVQGIKNVETIQGKKIEFECTIDANPKPDVAWFKGTRQLDEDKRIDISSEGNKYFLTIHDCYGEDADDYSVRASTAAGTRQSRARATIRSAPKIKLPARFETCTAFEKGETVILKIPFTGNPKPTCTWFKDGKQLKGSQHNLEVNGGVYRLNLENSLGSDSATLEFTVNDSPDAPHGLVVEQGAGTHVTLSWLSPLNNGGSTVTEYLVEKKDLTGDKWIRVATTRLKSLNIQSLEIGHAYQLRVTAANLYGYGSPSAPVDVALDEEVIKARKISREEAQVRGKKVKVDDYDKFYKDLWKDGSPKPAELKAESVHDYYEILEELGTGAFGVVHRCVEKATGKVFVAKFIDTPTSADKQAVRNEVGVMTQLHHPKLITLHDAFEDKKEMCLIVEFLSGGELFDRIADDNYKMSEAEVIKYMRQVVAALKHMHENNIVHLDIKPENIICETSKSTNVKIIDFGLATKLNPNVPVKVSTATAEFAAPEIANRQAVGYYTDMWACGVLSYVLLSGLSPFAGEDDYDTLLNVGKSEYDFDDEAFNNVSDLAKDFISKLLLKKPEDRMTVHQASEHPWIKEEHTELDRRIPASRYADVRDKMHEKYGIKIEINMPAIGIIANFSSIKKLRMEQFRIVVTEFDRKEAAPRFIIKPHSTTAAENSTVNLHATILSSSDPIVTWYHNEVQLSQSVKHMQRYQGKTFGLKVNRVRPGEDDGVYTCRAVNSFGRCEASCILTVTPDAAKDVQMETDSRPKKVFKEIDVEYPDLDKKPYFEFALRDRFIQEHDTFKLTCTLEGFPQPEVMWFHGNKEITNSPRYSVLYSSGRCSIEVMNAEAHDSGRYTCRAVNSLGEAECSCVVNVEESAGSRMTTGRGRRATSLQPVSFGSGGFVPSSVPNSNRLSRLSSQQDSIVSTSFSNTSSPRSRGVADFDTRYTSTSSNDGFDITTEYSKRVRRNVGGFSDESPRFRRRAGSEQRFVSMSSRAIQNDAPPRSGIMSRGVKDISSNTYKKGNVTVKTTRSVRFQEL
ncbi:twitchin-like [Watersipora subatra]|uniref:twitchin-like n=1 Tax=Watersipora subatra TaxID=2589382 RepID=UPI00355B0CA6